MKIAAILLTLFGTGLVGGAATYRVAYRAGFDAGQESVVIESITHDGESCEVRFHAGEDSWTIRSGEAYGVR